MKKLGELNLPGLPPIKVVSEEDAEQCDFVVCMKVADMPRLTSPDSVKEECSKCGVPVWFNQRTSPKEPPKICMDCMMKLPKEKP